MTKAKSVKAVKTVSNAAAESVAVTVTQAVNSTIQSAYDTLKASIAARQQYQIDNGNAKQADKWHAESKALTLHHVEKLQALGVDVSAMSARIAVAVKSDENFVAIYAMQKVRKLCSALLNGKSAIDGYTSTILQNVFALDKLNNKSALVSLSRGITFTETDQEQAIVKRYHCEPSTASTQASSSRKALQVLGAAQYERADKALIMKDTDTARALAALYQ